MTIPRQKFMGRVATLTTSRHLSYSLPLRHNASGGYIDPCTMRRILQNHARSKKEGDFELCRGNSFDKAATTRTTPAPAGVDIAGSGVGCGSSNRSDRDRDSDNYESGTGPFGGYRMAFNKDHQLKNETSKNTTQQPVVSGFAKQDFEKFLSLSKLMEPQVMEVEEPETKPPPQPVGKTTPTPAPAKRCAASFRLEDIRKHQLGQNDDASEAPKVTLRELRETAQQETQSQPGTTSDAETTSFSSANATAKESKDFKEPSDSAEATAQPESKLSSSSSTTESDLSSFNLDNLEQALRDAKQEDQVHANEFFRMQNAYNYAKSDKTIEKGNFFTGVPAEIRNEQQKNKHYEYVIVTPSQKLIYMRNSPIKGPLNSVGASSGSTDIFSVLLNLPHPERYAKNIRKLQKRGWKCIGTGEGAPNPALPGQSPADRLLIAFEREYNPFKRYSYFLAKLTFGTLGAIGIAFLGAVIIESPF